MSLLSHVSSQEHHLQLLQQGQRLALPQKHFSWDKQKVYPAALRSSQTFWDNHSRVFLQPKAREMVPNAQPGACLAPLLVQELKYLGTFTEGKQAEGCSLWSKT